MKNKTILELGSGTGLGGFTAAHCGASVVVLTDYLEALLLNLKHNISLQPKSIQDRVCVTKLDWNSPSDYPSTFPQTFSCIIAADVVYDVEHAKLLIQVFMKFLASDDPSSECWVMVPSVRTGWKEFEKELEDCGLLTVTKFVFYASKPKDIDVDHPQNWLLPQFDIPVDHFFYKIVWKSPNKI